MTGGINTPKLESHLIRDKDMADFSTLDEFLEFHFGTPNHNEVSEKKIRDVVKKFGLKKPKAKPVRNKKTVFHIDVPLVLDEKTKVVREDRLSWAWMANQCGVIHLGIKRGGSDTTVQEPQCVNECYQCNLPPTRNTYLEEEGDMWKYNSPMANLSMYSPLNLDY